jgi:hypothetical protein
MGLDRAHEALRRRISRAALALHQRLGAKGIFESRTLWAGHLGYMNDTSEVGHAMSVSREVVDRLKRELPEHQGALQRWTKFVTDSTPRSWAPNVFAVSFSEERDLLSQRRGYANGAGGPFCIGFPSDMLRERVDAGEGLVWTLRRCIFPATNKPT